MRGETQGIMAEQPKSRRCTRCGQDDALVVNFHWWVNRDQERELAGADVRCTKCDFSKHLVGYPMRGTFQQHP